MMLPKKTSWTENKDVWMSFVLNITLVIVLFFLGIFIGVFMSNKRLIESELLTRARSHFNNIIYTRSWNSQYGGVYVEKTKGIISNPYLKNPDITTTDGRILTKKNPAIMTREISELAARKDDYHFHITSLNPLNPGNAADAFEKKSLQAFEEGEKEIFGKEKMGNSVFYRYMAPLHVEKSCLPCHAEQGYKVGDVRGGISVTFNIDRIEKNLNTNRIIITILFILTTITLLMIIYMFIMKLNDKLARAMQKIEKMAITDPLTELHNRRYLMTRLEDEVARSRRYKHSLSCLLLDIDHFKKVNDTYGHHAGDVVLHTTAKMISESFRSSDVLARYGGEEFLIVLPETDTSEALPLAEKFRHMVELRKLSLDDFISINITVSIGVVGYSPGEAKGHEIVDQLIKDADIALYRAKKNGRNRVELYHSDNSQG